MDLDGQRSCCDHFTLDAQADWEICPVCFWEDDGFGLEPSTRGLAQTVEQNNSVTPESSWITASDPRIDFIDGPIKISLVRSTPRFLLIISMLLSSDSINRLRKLGLQLPSEPFFSPDHRAYPSGYLIMKPINVEGNSLASLSNAYKDGHTRDDTDAPVPTVWHASDRWNVSVWDWTPGPGPGDFVKQFADEDAAIDFIVHYFFGKTPEFSARLAHDNQRTVR
ncbi:CPCC family cysteine-rich protein [Burkholderia ubonensis]|uniref:CPCC family cysteine-rich protein n=1 Tax=Burkholderia ubonensis TaxID=101571 RepID=UPI0009B3F705|nr:CPCC family cysteine-rich protein [Burkholderia ubonensis]